jgi:septal ring factor EnvC (AmiA/AmiB activator)
VRRTAANPNKRSATARPWPLRGSAILALTLFSLVGAVGAATGPVLGQQAQESAESLKRTQQELQKAREAKRALAEQRENLAKDLQQLRQKLIHAAQDTQEREGIITNLEGQLDQLAAEKKRRTAALRERGQQLSGTLSALTRLSRNPPQSVLFQPGGPLQAVRGSLLLRTSVPTLRDQADVLREELGALDAVEADILDKLTELGDAERDLAGDRKKLNALIAEKKALMARANAQVEAANDRVAKLVKQAASLEELVAKLSASPPGETAPQSQPHSQPGASAPKSPVEPPRKDGTPPSSQAEAEAAETAVTALSAPPVGLRPFPASGTINRPVSGKVLRRYGQDTGFGHTSKGIVIQARSEAQITAPFDGKVAFAGPFQQLGLILIIEHSDGYHSVLAGLSRIDVGAGQWVLAGEPVGAMGLKADDGAADATRPELYVELRRDGQPVNPLRWISAQDGEPPAQSTELKSKT